MGEAKTTVWVAECGVYADSYTAGVYASAEAAIAAHPKGNWTQREKGYWENDLDWEDACYVAEYPVETGPLDAKDPPPLSQ